MYTIQYTIASYFTYDLLLICEIQYTTVYRSGATIEFFRSETEVRYVER